MDMSLNVLIVDDSAVMRAMVARTLRLSGLPVGEIYEASNGAEALDMLDKYWIDLALVDIHMPVMNGEQMIERVKERPDTADLPIVVVSSEGSIERVENLRNQGVLFIQKPFTPETLKHVVENVVGVKHDTDRTGAFQSNGADF
jgi:two-component system chemotaxis response regulator CheY